VAERGKRTRQKCEGEPFEILASLPALVEAADIVLSLVPPQAAAEVAASYTRAVQRAGRKSIYVDLNSIAPATAADIETTLAGAGGDFVDGAIHGLAALLPERGTVYLSGAKASTVAAALGKRLRVRVLGDAIGRASTFKMLIAGLNKGVLALVIEMCLLAEREQLLPELLGCYREAYPGVMEMVDRLLPTYPRHAGRRAAEMRELEETMRGADLEPCVATGARRVLEALAGLGLADDFPDRTPADWPVPAVLEELAARGLLRPQEQLNLAQR
jgi:3-hydroxyisobutyrate dehydrogenase-like beta-hydroxyacid dehydrogenase